MRDQAISLSAFSDRLTALGVGDDCQPVVACSGGPDSMALAILTDRWLQRFGRRAEVLIVNHGLRPEAGAEARQVASVLQQVGIAATVLDHTGARPQRDLQAAARAIRFGLMQDWMAAHGRRDLLLAHHQDDQAETVMLRLARGSGVDGLSAMSALTERDGIRLIRPLLGFPKSCLVATVEQAGLPYVTDPSNRDAGFARVRMRGLQAALAAEGMTPARLAATAERMARARDALNAARDAFLVAHVATHSAGYVTFDCRPFADLPSEIGLRVLSHMVRVIGANLYPPREAHLVAAFRAIVDGALKGGRTLAGTRILPWRGKILICREKAAMAAAVPLSPRLLWDDRYACQFDALGQGGAAHYAVGPLGVPRSECFPGAVSVRLGALPGAVRPTLPALWSGDDIVAVPHLGYAVGQGDVVGSIAFRGVSDAWGADIRQRLPFSNR